MIVGVVAMNATDIVFDFVNDTYGLTRYDNSSSPSHSSKPKGRTVCAFGPMASASIKNPMPVWTFPFPPVKQ